MEKLANIIKTARESKKLSQAELAKLVNASQSAISGIETGRNKETKLLSRLAKVLNIAPEKLGIPPQEDFVIIPSLSVRACCGKGISIDHVCVEGGFAFRREWLDRMGLNEKNLEVIRAYGDSMYPTIRDGEVLLIDKSAVRISASRNDVYLVIFDGDIMIKRIKKSLNGNTLALISDNPDKVKYEDREIDCSEENQLIDTLAILGKIVWRGGVL